MKQKYFRFCAICAVILFGEAVAAQQYCTPPPGANCDTDKIMNVSFAGISNNSDCAASGYENYTNLAPGQVTAGTSYPLSVSTEFESTAVGVWIDYNQDRIFSAAEFTDLGVSTVTNTTLAAVVAIPSDAVGGSTRMRVKCQLSVAVSENSACSLPAWDNGETEDYTILITPATASTYDYSIKNVRLYPNPADDFITIMGPEGMQIKKLSIHDLAGQLVLHAYDGAATLNVQNLAKGIYIIKILTEERSSAIRFIKN